jgi:uncharacterized protein
MKTVREFLKLMLAAVAAITMLSVPAYALDTKIEDAMARGIVGEQADGYLGYVNNRRPNDAELERLVSATNIRRREAYTEIAGRTGESVANVGIVTALRLIDRLPPGQYYKDGQGAWIRK